VSTRYGIWVRPFVQAVLLINFPIILAVSTGRCNII